MNRQRDLRSKLLDGLLPAVVLYLLDMLAIMPVRLIERSWGGPGLLIYLLGLMAVAMFSLQQAVSMRFSEVTRAWYGMAGGILAWAVIAMASQLEGRLLWGPTPVILIIMAGLFTLLMWRRYLPLGARFFLVACLASGMRQLSVQFLLSVSGWSPATQMLTLSLGVTSGVGALVAMGWIFAGSTRQIPRMWAALAAALLALTAVALLGGGTF